MRWRALLAVAAGGGSAALVLWLRHAGALVAAEQWLADLPVWRGAGLRAVTPLWEQSLTVLAALAAAWFTLHLPHRSRRAGFLLALAFLTLTLTPAAAMAGWFFQPIPALCALSMAGAIAWGPAASERAWRHRKLRRYFAGRLRDDLFDQLLGDGDGRQLTSRREVSAVTCQMLNHAELARELEPAELEDFSSTFLKVIAEFLVMQGGYLDECDVHRVRVLFGFPRDTPDHAPQAARAALLLRQRMANLAGEMEHRWHRRPLLGAVVGSGEVNTGLFGFRDFEFFSAVGSSLDFAERLCPLNEEYGTQLLLSAGAFAACRDEIEARPLEMVTSPGLGPASEVYELLALKGVLSEEAAAARDAFWQGVILYRRRDFTGALAQFSRAEQEAHVDAPLAWFQRKTRAALGMPKSPPPHPPPPEPKLDTKEEAPVAGSVSVSEAAPAEPKSEEAAGRGKSGRRKGKRGQAAAPERAADPTPKPNVASREAASPAESTPDADDPQGVSIRTLIDSKPS
jgi:class 3 adenylate cyclase